MFNVLLILIFVGGILIAAVFAGVTFLQGVRSAQEIQITRQRLIETAARIQSQARYISGYMALPKGNTGGSPYVYNQVPSWISSYARNAAGVPFLYCPYRSTANGGSASTVIMPSGSTYNVTYVNSNDTILQNYVVGGDAPDSDTPAGTIGVLIAAAPQSNQPPDCDDITAASDGTPIVSGGIVAVIQDNFLNKMKVASVPSELRIYVASSATGDGSGRDTNNYALLATAINMLDYAKPAQVTIVLGNGSFSFSNLSWGGRVQIEGTSTALTTISVTSLAIDEFSLLSVRNATLSNTGTLTIKGELQLDTANIATTTGISVIGGKLSSIGTNTISGNITVDGGGQFINANGSTLSVGGITNRGLKITNGDFIVDSGILGVSTTTANIVLAYVGAGGNFQTTGAVNMNSTASTVVKGGFVIDPGGRVGNASSSGILTFYYTDDFAVYAHGGLELSTGALQTRSTTPSGLAYGVILASGGYLIDSQHSGTGLITSNATANRPNIAVYDNGGSRFIMSANTSASTIQAKTDCWHGRSGTNLFSDTANAGTSTGHVSYTATSGAYRWLRLYNQSYSSCTIL